MNCIFREHEPCRWKLGQDGDTICPRGSSFIANDAECETAAEELLREGTVVSHLAGLFKFRFAFAASLNSRDRPRHPGTHPYGWEWSGSVHHHPSSSPIIIIHGILSTDRFWNMDFGLGIPTPRCSCSLTTAWDRSRSFPHPR